MLEIFDIFSMESNNNLYSFLPKIKNDLETPCSCLTAAASGAARVKVRCGQATSLRRVQSRKKVVQKREMDG